MNQLAWVIEGTPFSHGRVHNLLSFEEVVVKGVHVNINSRGRSGEEACPLPGKREEDVGDSKATLARPPSSSTAALNSCSPSVVLGVEQEVRAHDGDAHGHDAQDDQDQHHEAVHVVDFVGPERCEDEVPVRGVWWERWNYCRVHLTANPLPRLTFQWKWSQMEGFPQGRRWPLVPWT